MVQIYEADTNAFINAVAEALKKEDAVTPPEWAKFAKTGVHRERPPQQKDWWYLRSAAVMRKIHTKGPIGVSKLRTLYGGKRNAGMAHDHYARGSGNVLRKVLQQLEAAGFATQAQKGTHKGRILTPKGVKFLNGVAKGLPGEVKEAKVEAPKEPKEAPKEEVKVEEKKEATVEEPKSGEPKAEQKEEAPAAEAQA
ncbi:MAG: 30S ribosomal protein S19e [Candidatus Nanoarchaeia archaeon]